MTQCKLPLRKTPRHSPRYSIKSETRSKSRASQVSSPGSESPSIDELKQRSPTSPSSSIHESHELVTTLSRLGVNTEECSSSLSPDGTPRKKIGQRNKNNYNEGSPKRTVQGGSESNIGRTYREPQHVRKRDSFVAMETEDPNDDGFEDIYDNAKQKRKIEWRFWKWSFKDVDKCRTMILTSRIFIFTVVVIFNIIYWSIALGGYE